jgi:hypothetical protein
MNMTKALDLMTDTEQRMKEIDAALHELRNSLAAIAELDNGARADLVLKCDGGASEMYIGNLIGVTELTAFVKDRIEILARSNFEKLLGFKPVKQTEAEEPAEVKIPEELMKKKPETEEDPAEDLPEIKYVDDEPEQAPVPKVIGRNGKAVVNDVLIDRLYFKEGKSAKSIAQETGLSESAVFNHISKIRAAKLKTAKECVRH